MAYKLGLTRGSNREKKGDVDEGKRERFIFLAFLLPLHSLTSSFLCHPFYLLSFSSAFCCHVTSGPFLFLFHCSKQFLSITHCSCILGSKKTRIIQLFVLVHCPKSHSVSLLVLFFVLFCLLFSIILGKKCFFVFLCGHHKLGSIQSYCYKCNIIINTIIF